MLTESFTARDPKGDIGLDHYWKRVGPSVSGVAARFAQNCTLSDLRQERRANIT